MVGFGQDKPTVSSSTFWCDPRCTLSHPRQAAKVYVQDRLRESADLVWSLLNDKVREHPGVSLGSHPVSFVSSYICAWCMELFQHVMHCFRRRTSTCVGMPPPWRDPWRRSFSISFNSGWEGVRMPPQPTWTSCLRRRGTSVTYGIEQSK